MLSLPSPARTIRSLAVAVVAAIAPAQHPTQQEDAQKPMYVAPRSDEGKAALATFQLASGLTASLVAAEPDLCNVVAFTVDDQGRIWVSETFRIHDGVFDTREYMQWKDDDLACLTVRDRVAKYEKHIATAIPKYAGYSERVKLLVDDDRDYVVDRSSVFADGFASLADGIASGVLPVGGDVWFTDIPALWRLRDQDGDGTADQREAVFDGFGVHTSLIGHDLHGLVVGPDRRLWFSIGDRGFHVVTKEGRTLAYPHEGAVLRCELDGSNLEVVHRGLRNPQELAFDDAGNLFTGDNNSDGGDRARLVQIVDGADCGWRIGFQWLDDRGAWNREALWQPQHPGQPAWVHPPIMNVADGPSGLAFDPGQGLPARYRGCLFLCDFRGGSSYSGVHALRLDPKGAGFELAWRDKPIWGVLATDLDFGPDGALYVSDWVSGWNKTGKGRIYRIEQPGQRNELVLRQTARLLAAGLADRSEAQLLDLLAHSDRRVRQHAQFALVDRGACGTLLAAAKGPDRPLARRAGIWGLGILGRKDKEAVAPLLPLCEDGDADVRAQVARVLGEARAADCSAPLVRLLKDHSARVRREAALAIGKLGKDAGDGAVPALLAMLADNDDRDPVLRHAAVMGLCGTATPEQLHKERGHAKRAVRAGVLLALRRLGDAEVAVFLHDADTALRAEAARAIYDGGIDAALPQLAATLGTDVASDHAVAWRALNAARLLGLPEHGAAIAAFAADAAASTKLRVEAVRILAEWRTPHGQDRVLGNWRPSHRERDDEAVQQFAPSLPPLLADDELAEATSKACASLRLVDASPTLAALARARDRPAGSRIAALQALAVLDEEALDGVVAAIDADDPASLRGAAVKLFAERAPAKAAPVLATLCQKAELQERQAAFLALGTLRDPAGARILGEWLDALQRGTVDAEVQLDLLEAAGKRTEPEVQQALQRALAARDANDALATFRPCLRGGDKEAGRRIVFDHEATRCTRCHTIDGKGGAAGPRLDGIGKSQTREYLLEALVLPSKTIAAGFAATMIELHDGDLAYGVVTKDEDGAVEVTNSQGEVRSIPRDRIKERRPTSDSAMPVMAGPLDHRQLRDVVAFLASLQDAASK